MIANCVEYSDEERALVKQFEELKDKKPSEWKEEQYANLKDKIKAHYQQEQNYICAYCKIEVLVKHGMVWDTEHIIARDDKPQFMFEPENLCVACKDCNVAKGAKKVLKNQRRTTFPTKNTDYKLVHPHFDNYDEHIRNVVPGDVYRPLSEKGKFTIETCGLLRFYGIARKEQPEKEIDELAKALLVSDGYARQVLEDQLIGKILAKCNRSSSTGNMGINENK